MSELKEIRSEIKELKGYKKFLCLLEKKATFSGETQGQKNSGDKPKVKKLEVRKNEHH